MKASDFAIGLLASLLPLSGFAASHSKASIIDRAHSTINGNVNVVDYDGVRLLVATAQQGVEIDSLLELKNHHRLIAPYTQIMSMVTALHPSPRDAFNMGLGGGTLPHFHLFRYPKAHVDSVEIDPAIVRLARKDFFVSSPRHTILEGDGFETLSREKTKYDIIWMDEFTPKEGPKAMIPAEYLKILRDHLKPDGFLIVHLGTAKSPRTFDSAISDYRTGFRYAIHVRGPASSALGSNGFDEIAALRAVGLTLSKRHEASLERPEHIIAVSNNPRLNCKRFRAIARKWRKEKLSDLDWSKKAAGPLCEDLHS